MALKALEWTDDTQADLPPVDEHCDQYAEYESAEADGYLFTASRRQGDSYVKLRIVTDQKEVYGSACVNMTQAKGRAVWFLHRH
jgi:hypothetical protein